MKEQFDKLANDSRLWFENEMSRSVLAALRRLLIEVYPQDAHFIFELLQNAEDQKASKVEFELTREQLKFRHDGKSFDFADVQAISRVACSTKVNEQDEDTRIGKFGIGFKSVYAYTNSPMIVSGEWRFKVKNLVIPEYLDDGEIQAIGDAEGFTTTFVLPFDHERKLPMKAVTEISGELNALTAKSFLFLRHIEEVRVSMPEGGFVFKKSIPKNHHLVVVKYSLDGQVVSQTRYLRFDDDVVMEVEEDGRSLQRKIPIGLAYRLADGEVVSDSGDKLLVQRIVSDPEASVFIHFPAPGENSGLRYSIHASFAPTVSRSEIRDIPENHQLLEAIASLQEKSFGYIKESGLLSTEFFDVLPNSKDVLGQKYDVIRKSALAVFKRDPLIPTKAGGFAKASDVRRGSQIFQRVLTDPDLCTIMRRTDLVWAKNPAQKNTNADRFFEDIGIEVFGIQALARECRGNQDCITVFRGKSNPELALLYVAARKEYAAWADESFRNNISNVPFIRLQTEELVAAECGRRLVRGGAQNVVGAVLIHDDFDKYIREWKEGETLKEFFKRLNIDLYDEVSNLKYYVANFRREERAVNNQLLEENELYFCSMLDLLVARRLSASDCLDFPVYCKDKSWRKLSESFIDSPYEETDLSLIATDLFAIQKFQLSDVYRSMLDANQTKLFCDNAKQLKVMKTLSVVRIDSVSQHVKAAFLYSAPGNVMKATKEEVDFRVEVLDKIMRRMQSLRDDQEKILRLGRMLWRVLISSKCEWLKASYKPNRGAEGRSVESSFVIQMKEGAWIPTADGLKKPSDVDQSSLPDGWEWPMGGYDNPALNAVGFGAATADVRKEAAAQEKVCKALGFENIAELRRFAELREKLIREGKNVGDLMPDTGGVSDGQDDETVSNAEKAGEPSGKKDRVNRCASEDEKYFALDDELRKRLVEIQKVPAKGQGEDILGDKDEMVMPVSKLLKMNLRIPNYQRPYKWGKDNVWDFMDDIMRMVVEKKRQNPEKDWCDLPYRMGSIILHSEKDEAGKRVFNIVDGQQRTLTFILLAFALGMECGLLRDPDFYPALSQLPDSRRNLNNNLCYIADYLKMHGEQCRDDFKEALAKSLQVVVVCVTERDYAFQLFDSQNVKGRRLEPHDLLKAYHLREFDEAIQHHRGRYEQVGDQKEDPRLKAVTKWEDFNIQDLSYLFDKLLYPILKWSARERCYGFTTKDLKAFKGVPQHFEGKYGYVDNAFAIAKDGRFCIGSEFAPGKGFFDMVSHYQELLGKIRERVNSCPKVKDIVNNGSNNAYIKALFESVLMAYFDRFGFNLPEEDIKVAINTLCKWVYSARLDLEYFSPKTPNKYALGVVDGSTKYTNRIAMFYAIKNAVFHTDIAKLSVKMSQATRDSQKNNERKSLWDLVNAL